MITAAHSLASATWQTRERETIPLGDMTDSHLWFAIRLMERNMVERGDGRGGPRLVKLGLLYRERERRERKKTKGGRVLGYYIIDANGTITPVPLLKWAAWYETSESVRRVAYTTVLPGIEVSTIFLSIDHQWGVGPPILWETMVFGGVRDGYQQRYSTREEALVGHALIVDVVRVEEGRAVAVREIAMQPVGVREATADDEVDRIILLEDSKRRE